MIVTVNVTISVLSSGIWCRFDIEQASVEIPVSRGDRFIFCKDPKVIGVVAGTDYMWHLHSGISDEDESTTIRVDVTAEDYDEMLRQVAHFRTNNVISNFSSNDVPASYYLLYRSAMEVLGWTAPTCNESQIHEFAEACRAVVLAEIEDDTEFWGAYINLNFKTSQLETILLQILNENKQIDLLRAVKVWEQCLVNSEGSAKWTASVEKCKQTAEKIQTRFPKIAVSP